MKRLLWLLAALLLGLCLSIPAIAQTYVSQSGGTVNCTPDGSASQSTTAIGSVSWTTSGDYRLCGTITSQVTISASGTSGTPLYLRFENGATIAPTVCAQTGCIDVNGNGYIIIDGNPSSSSTPCGWVNVAKVACNGSISPTASGTAFGNGATSSVGIDIQSASNSIEIRNLAILNTYVHTYLSSDQPGGDFFGIYEQGVSTCSSVHIHNNDIENTGSALAYVAETANESCLEYNNNYMRYMNTGTDIANSGVTINGAKIHDNGYFDTYNWDIQNFQTTGCGCCHHNSMHVFSAPTNNVAFYNNFVGGNWGGCMTAELFYEGGSWNNNNCQIYGNLFIATYDFAPNNGLVSLSCGGTNYYDNNTMLGSSQGGNGLDLSYKSGTGTTGTWDARNNVMCCENTLFFNNIGIAFSPIDYNLWTGTTGNIWGINCVSGCTYYTSLAAWQTATGGEVHSAYNSSTSYPNISTSTGIPNGGSPVLGFGTNLASLESTLTALGTDLYGNSRPGSGAWTGGAINASGTVLPSAPSVGMFAENWWLP